MSAPATHFVVGSGPSGVACAHALLEQGRTVQMLDAGLKLEDGRARAVEQLSKSAPKDWDPKLVALLKENMTAGAKGIPQKLVFGSDFPYREIEKGFRYKFDGVGVKPSLAEGGLSNVWGAAMMPHLEADLDGWPVKTTQLTPHYEAVLKLTGISARRDDLSARFPLYTSEPGALELSRQARGMLEALERNRFALNGAGIHFGASRVAIQAKRTPDGPGCVYCGMCMFGCPYGYIYNSASTLRELQKHERFIYQSDIIVTGFSETADGVTVRAKDRTGGADREVQGARLYLAAGAIPTTRMLLASRQAYDQTVWMKDSQYFLVPMLLFKRARDVRREALHTLSQLFLEMLDPEISPHAVHLQVYSYSELIGDALRASLKRFGLNFNWLASRLEDRLVVVQGFLHSNESSRIGVTLRKGAPDSLELKADVNSEAARIVKKVVAKLARNARKLGTIPLPPMVEVAEPGRSFHSGGTFPMREQPGAFESDVLGRPNGWTRVHAVDATVLTCVPATTVTFAVMANAHRIATESATLA